MNLNVGEYNITIKEGLLNELSEHIESVYKGKKIFITYKL